MVGGSCTGKVRVETDYSDGEAGPACYLLEIQWLHLSPYRRVDKVENHASTRPLSYWVVTPKLCCLDFCS